MIKTVKPTLMVRALALSFAAMAVLVISATAWVFWHLQPVDSTNTDTIELIIVPGSGVQSIAEQLHEKELIRSPLLFRVVVRYMNRDARLQAGTFTVAQSMSPFEVIEVLSVGRDQSIRITLLEGWRREEMAEYLAQQDLPNVQAEEFLELTADLEGTLFPDTYLLSENTTTAQLVRLLTDTFNQKVTQPLAAAYENSSLTPEEVLILASIVEREARRHEDRRHVAGILLNRLRIGMALQADATFLYARGYDPVSQSWWLRPLAENKNIQSPYNTYQQPGLPPGPICNPSFSSIQAVLDPTPSDDLFYIHTSSGDVHYARTYEEHNANIRRYLR